MDLPGRGRCHHQSLLNGEIMPFIIAFPTIITGTSGRDNLRASASSNDIHPGGFIETHRTIPNPRSRAIGGMSRGAGWALSF
ncbi:MAG: hypothetical protein U0X92_13185 [Anaerolineales bacterium]